jgi:hypothetical protein
MLNKEMEEWKATSLTPGEEVLVGFLTMKIARPPVLWSAGTCPRLRPVSTVLNGKARYGARRFPRIV